MNLKNIKLEEELKNRILILDGAMGTVLKKYKLSPSDFNGAMGCYEILNDTQANIIQKIHEEYILAGADIIETNSFNCNSINLAKYGLEKEVYFLAKKSAEIARKSTKISSKKIFVLGAVGPTNRSLTYLKNKNFSNNLEEFLELKNIFKEQISGLVDGEVDGILIETVFDGINAKAALLATEEILKEKGKDLPILISMTVSEDGKLVTEESVEDLIKELDRKSIIAFGFNCLSKNKDLDILINRIKSVSEKYIILYLNAGIPNKNGNYSETKEDIKEVLKPLLREKLLNIIGGCCGTDYSYIETLKNL